MLPSEKYFGKFEAVFYFTEPCLQALLFLKPGVLSFAFRNGETTLNLRWLKSLAVHYSLILI
ncbi:hypothetical protein PM3016_682 [Paenibacillus mucilaginosus 3016]|uniref:Uncharacterized protein n=1 Tax=Paenibacillus mucilaginosus 3016 TaxID=1116391 RepID=H6NTP8_9BACL|nr:hypothetical protein PM3016_682 [Paenibacillus mucilaginosus 3016]